MRDSRALTADLARTGISCVMQERTGDERRGVRAIIGDKADFFRHFPSALQSFVQEMHGETVRGENSICVRVGIQSLLCCLAIILKIPAIPVCKTDQRGDSFCKQSLPAGEMSLFYSQMAVLYIASANLKDLFASSGSKMFRCEQSSPAVV